jgi:CHAT domain-containing protein/tetratricopeptide (TPR) repeat protein
MMHLYPAEFKRCLRAFTERKYAACAEQAMALFQEHETHELMQLVFISSQRLGAAELVAGWWEQLAAPLEKGPWFIRAFVGLTLGQIDLSDVLARTGDDEIVCRAHYYAGAAHLTPLLLDLAEPDEERLRAACAAFDAAAALDVDCLERKLAAAELERLELERLSPLPRGATREDREEYFRLVEPAGSNVLTADWPKVRDKMRRAEAFALARFGDQHPLYLAAMSELAWGHVVQNELAEAEPLFLRAEELCRCTLGERHPKHANLLKGLGYLRERQGQHTQAERLLRRAVTIYQRATGDEHPDHLGTLVHLANVCISTRALREAESVLKRALSLQGSAVQADPDTRNRILNGLARVLVDQGHFGQARPLLDELARLSESMPSFGRCIALANLGWLHHRLGNGGEAARLFSRAVTEAREINHSDLPAMMVLAASVLEQAGILEDAEGLYRAAVERMRDAGRTDHEHFAVCLGYLGNLLLRTGRIDEAEQHFLEALRIDQAAVGDSHPGYAIGLMNLGECYRAAGKLSLAESCCERAHKVLSETLGEEHPDYAGCLYKLGLLAAAQGRKAEALARLERANRVTDGTLGQVFTAIAENERLALLVRVRHHLDSLLSFVQQHDRSPDAVGSAFDLVQRRKGVGAEAASVLRSSVLGGAYPHLRPRLERLAETRGEIARLALAGPGSEGRTAHRERLATLEADRNELEAELARQIPEVGLETQFHTANRYTIAASLPAGAALVEYVRADDVDFEAAHSRDERQLPPARYLAFVLSAGQPEQVQMLDLGEADPIDQMISDFRAIITTPPWQRTGGQKLWREKDESPSDPQSPSPASPPIGTELRQRVFDPLVQALGSHTQLWLSPDGDLSRLPFEVLPARDKGKLLLDTYRISYLATGRDVLRCSQPARRQPTPALVAADPDFDLSAQPPAPSPPSSDNPDRPRSRCSHNIEATRAAGRLPGTRVEGERIAALLGVQPVLSGDVLDQQLKALHSPRILHLATHGFFLQDQHLDPGIGWRDVAVMGVGELLPSSRLENPLLRSGLLLAGFNTWLRHGQLPPAAEDGMLTAEDVTGMDLLDTELVVLSACETGLGQVHVGEGVFGLRRAFAVAGAKTLVMSLWKVPDEQTQELMVDFYQHILGVDGKPRVGVAEALRKAQQAVRARHPDPYFWGAFICQGDPGPLRS